MGSKIYRILAFAVILSMLVLPVSAQPAGTSSVSASKEAAGATAQMSPILPRLGLVESESKAPATESGLARYFVFLTDPAAPMYFGDIAGLEATSIEASGGSKFNAKSEAAQAYVSYLKGKQSGFLAEANALLGRTIKVASDYQYAANALSLELTRAEALRLAEHPEVRIVSREQEYYTDTDYGPQWIGAPGIWNGTSVPGGIGTKGEGVVVGVIDSGVNYDNPSFAAVGPIDGYVHTNPLGAGTYLGYCATNPGFCNDKLIGAYEFTSLYFVPAPGLDERPTPDDEGVGHGSHTSSTAAGNTVTGTLVAPTAAYTATISGVAPHANIIMYDVCYYNNNTGTGPCIGSALLDSVDQIILDGVVDVVNYSISGGSNPYTDPIEIGFLNATSAGIFVATSAGNSGPTGATVGHRSPWVAATAATTHNRQFVNSLINMTGGTNPPSDKYGVGFAGGVGPAPIVWAGNYGNVLCLPVPGFPPGTFTGKIVVCDRGTNARVEKAQVVAAAGAVGFVLANTSAGQSLNGDSYVIPGVHLSFANASPVKAWIAANLTTTITATVGGLSLNTNVANADITAAFSSRGPSVTIDVMKPNIGAPGVDIMASVHTPDPLNRGGADYNLLGGTSMASPHLAGAAALLKAKFPTFLPARIMAMLQTTAVTNILKEDGVTPANPFDVGSGRVDLSKAAKAGFTLPESAFNFFYSDPALGGDPRSLNLPSFYNSKCAINCTWNRTLRSITSVPMTYTVSVSAPFTITVTPSSFTLAPGASLPISVLADMKLRNLGIFEFGRITFTPSDPSYPTQTMPVVVNKVNSNLPSRVTITTFTETGTYNLSGLQAIDITALQTSVNGLSKAMLKTQNVLGDPTNGNAFDDLSQVMWYTATVPAGQVRLVAEVVDTTSTDVDLFVGRDTNANGLPEAGETVCTSATGEVFEYCNINNPAAGVWWVVAQNWQASGPAGDDITMATGAVPAGAAGNLTATGPSVVPQGQQYSIALGYTLTGSGYPDRYYGTLTLGTDAGNPTNLGTANIDIRRRENARVQVAHLAPFADTAGSSVTVKIDGADALTNFKYGDSTAYVSLPPGPHQIDIVPTGSITPAITANLTLMDGVDYTAIATGDGANQPLALKALMDDNTMPMTGTAHVRIGHLAPFASVITNTLADVRVQTITGTIVLLNDVPYGAVTGYIPLPAGAYDLVITTADGGIELIDLAPVTLTSGQIISVFAVGGTPFQRPWAYGLPSNAPGFFLPINVIFNALMFKNAP
jgi:subtilisin family serine protease